MARRARCELEAEYHHVYSHAVEGDVFVQDRCESEIFLSLLERALRDVGVTCLAYATPRTHFHLLLKALVKQVSDVMESALGAYARVTNNRRGRRGHLMWGRFKSTPVTTSRLAMIEAVYVTGNLNKHGFVSALDELAEHPWSSYGEVVGTRPVRLIDVDPLLTLFGTEPELARTAFADALEERFGAWSTQQPVDDDLAELMQRVCTEHGRSVGQVRGPGSGHREVRRRIVRLSDEELGIDDSSLAKALDVSRTTIWRMRKGR